MAQTSGGALTAIEQEILAVVTERILNELGATDTAQLDAEGRALTPSEIVTLALG
jgi:hypothetical protein